MLAEAWLWLVVASGPLLFGAVEPWSLFILQSLLVFFPLVCALSLPRSQESMLKAPFVPSLLVILALGGLQLLSPRPLLGPQTGLLSTVDPARTSAALVLYACYGAVLVCAPRVLARPGAGRRLAWMMFLLGSAIGCIGLLQTAQGNKFIYGLRVVAPDRNPFGPYYNRDHAAALMVMALPIGAGLAYGRLSLWRRAGSFEAKANLAAQTALLALPLGALGGALYFISSRGATLGLAGGTVLAFLWILAETRVKQAALVLLLLGGGAVVSRPVLARLASLDAATEPSVATRVSMYRSGAEIWKDSPLFGVGLGAFSSAFAPYWENPQEGQVDHLHCDWVEAAIESGLVGLGAIVVGFCLFLLNLGGMRMTALEVESGAVRMGALIAVGAGVLHAFVEFGLRIPGNAVFILTTVALAHVAGPKSNKAPGRAVWREALFPALAVCAFAVLAGRRLAAVLPEVREAGLTASAAFNRVVVQGRQPSSDYRFGLAQALARRAEAEPERRIELLRAALTQVRAGLLHDSANPAGHRIMAAILAALGRDNDALLHWRLAAFG